MSHIKTGKIKVHQDLQKTAWLSHRLWSESGQWKMLPSSQTPIIFPASVSLNCLSSACLLLALCVACISALSPSSSPLCHFVSSVFISSPLSSPRSVIPHRVSCWVCFSFLFLFLFFFFFFLAGGNGYCTHLHCVPHLHRLLCDTLGLSLSFPADVWELASWVEDFPLCPCFPPAAMNGKTALLFSY